MESAVADQPITESPSAPVDPVPAPAAPDPSPAPQPDPAPEPAPAPDPLPADLAPEPAPEPGAPDVPSDPEPEAPPVVFEPERVTTIVVTQYTRRGDHDVLPGHFARLEAGEHVGEIGVFESVAVDGPDGYPALVNVTLRDSGERIVCSYGELTPAPFGGR